MKGLIFDLQRFSLSDGPGIRTTLFLKGCPLRCLWCHNPESMRQSKEIMFFPERCRSCGACVWACPNGAQTVGLNGRNMDFGRCTGCLKCTAYCRFGALSVVGWEVTVEEIAEELERDRPYYEGSGGGVTISGGEPTLQASFVAQLCAVLKGKGLHLALDTCGHTCWDDLARIATQVDLVLLDIKHLDPARHRALTGITNGLILDNLGRLLDAGIPVSIRFPLIPGQNDDDEHIERLAGLLRDHRIDRVEVIPYHSLGLSKYRQLGRSCLLDGLRPPGENYVQAKMGVFQRFGVCAERM